MSALEVVLDYFYEPSWVPKLPAWLGFPLFVIWFLVLLLPVCLIVIPIALWEAFKDARP